MVRRKKSTENALSNLYVRSYFRWMRFRHITARFFYLRQNVFLKPILNYKRMSTLDKKIRQQLLPL